MKAQTKHRWWLLNALWASMLVVANVVLLAAGSYGAGWLLMALVPVTVAQWTGWRKTRPPRPRPDYARIAELERDLLDGPAVVDPLLIRHEKR